MASAMKKVNMITQIVRLRQIVRRWKTKSLSRGGSLSSSDSDDSATSRCRTPSGTLGVYVGPDRMRFVIPTRFLNFPVFVSLLNKAEEEFGFQTTGGLVLPCEPGFFAELLRFLHDDEDKFSALDLDEFVNIVSDVTTDHLSCKDSSSPFAFAPLLPKASV